MGEISLGSLKVATAAQGTTFRRVLVDVLNSMLIRQFFAINNKGNMGNKKLPNFKHQQHISLPLSSTTLINTNVYCVLIIIIIIIIIISSSSSSVRTFMKKSTQTNPFPVSQRRTIAFHCALPVNNSCNTLFLSHNKYL